MEIAKNLVATIAAMNEYGVVFHNEFQVPRRLPVSHYAIYKDSIGTDHVVYIPHEKKFNTHGHAYITIQKIQLSEEGVPVLQHKSKLGMLILAGFDTPEAAIRKSNERSNTIGQFVAVGKLTFNGEENLYPDMFNTFNFTTIKGCLNIEAAGDELIALAKIVRQTHDAKSAKSDRASLKQFLAMRRESMNSLLNLIESYIDQIPDPVKESKS